jgi:hypothetical protein
LELKDSSGKPISDNFYWLAGRKQDYRLMDNIAPASLDVTAHVTPVTNGGSTSVRRQLSRLSSS